MDQFFYDLRYKSGIGAGEASLRRNKTVAIDVNSSWFQIIIKKKV
ncbi:MAG: hypothetical protein ACRCZ0_09310 [Cetobacterium sp.]